MRIDVVIPFVDGSDPIWRELYKKEFNEDPIAKYRSNSDLFKYNLRSIAKNMPWINNLYIIAYGKHSSAGNNLFLWYL